MESFETSELFRDVLVAGARACDMEPTTIAEKSTLEHSPRPVPNG
jgi:hypothetical protein